MDNLPAQLSGLLKPAHKRNNTDAIIAYLLCEDGTATLTDEQRLLLERANYADQLMLEDTRKASQIPALIVKRFGGSEQNAWRDLKRAQEIFGKSRALDKNYLLMVHIERIERAMQVHNLAKPSEKAKLFAVYTQALDKLPSEEKNRYQPAVMIFNFGGGNSAELTHDSTVSAEDAEATALRLLGEEEGEYIDHEDLTENDA